VIEFLYEIEMPYPPQFLQKDASFFDDGLGRGEIKTLVQCAEAAPYPRDWRSDGWAAPPNRGSGERTLRLL